MKTNVKLQNSFKFIYENTFQFTEAHLNLRKNTFVIFGGNSGSIGTSKGMSRVSLQSVFMGICQSKASLLRLIIIFVFIKGISCQDKQASCQIGNNLTLQQELKTHRTIVLFTGFGYQVIIDFGTDIMVFTCHYRYLSVSEYLSLNSVSIKTGSL